MSSNFSVKKICNKVVQMINLLLFHLLPSINNDKNNNCIFRGYKVCEGSFDLFGLKIPTCETRRENLGGK